MFAECWTSIFRISNICECTDLCEYVKTVSCQSTALHYVTYCTVTLHYVLLEIPDTASAALISFTDAQHCTITISDLVTVGDWCSMTCMVTRRRREAVSGPSTLVQCECRHFRMASDGE